MTVSKEPSKLLVKTLNPSTGLILSAEVANINCDFILDTGSNVTLISSSLLPSGVKLKPSNVRICSITGESATVKGEWETVIRLGSFRKRIPILVADLPCEGILGMDFLSENNCSINLSQKILWIGKRKLPLRGESIKHQISASVNLCTSSKIMIPAYHEKFVVTKAGNNSFISQGLVQPKFEDLPKGLLVAKTLCCPQQNRVLVRIANISGHNIHIPSGTPIASIEEAECLDREVCHCISSRSIVATHNNEELPDHLSELYERSIEFLNSHQKQVVKNLLIKFQNVFSKGIDDMGRTSLALHSIDVGDSRPIKQPHRRQALAKQEETDNIVRDMLRQDIIEPSYSPWSSPVVLVKKKNGATRFCIDYRKLNNITTKDSFPLPRIDDTLDATSGSKWFSTLDLQSGYWQIEMNPRDKPKTAFVTSHGLWQFKVMPFGLCNAPATFERLMTKALAGLPLSMCLIYLDDILVHAKTFEEAETNISKGLERLKQANLKINPTKCNLFRAEVRYLGHVLSSSGLKPDNEKVDVVRNWPRPRDLHEVRSFLGLCTYYRRFIQNFSLVARPLHHLTEKGQTFLWNHDCESAFVRLKEFLTSAPILAFPSQEKEFILDTDASNLGIGAVLSQQDDELCERVIAYFSKSLSKAEKNYCTTRKELLALVKAVEHFHPYLYGRKFKLRTDHAALNWLLTFKNPEGQIARWLERLQQYNFTIEHRAGSKHINADVLSRRPCAVESCRHCDLKDQKYNASDDPVHAIRTLNVDLDEEELKKKNKKMMSL